MNLKGKNLISISDYSKEEYLEILRLAEEFEKNPKQEILRDKVVASIFFEPSTRTRLSFESAASMLGAKVIGFSNPSATSQSKGESLHDTIKMLSSYVDIIVMRHSIEGAARYAAEVASVPFINAGDGANQHPTQCMLDLYSILKTQGKLENLNITLVGDLKYGRTVHSLVQAMCNFNATFHLVSPNELKLPSSVKMHIKDANLKYEQYTKLEDVIPFSDIIYMTTSEDRYCFIGSPDEIKEEISNLNQANLLTENCSGSEIKVCFNNQDCDINVNYNLGRVEKNNEFMYFDDGDTALMYAGIFSDKSVYECQLRRLMLRVKELSLLYIDKETISTKRGCVENNLAGDLGTLSSLAESLKNSDELELVKIRAEDIDEKNDARRCLLW